MVDTSQFIEFAQGCRIPQATLSSTQSLTLERTRHLVCEQEFATRTLFPDPFILVNRLLDAPIRSQLPRLTLPVRNSGQLLSLERRSVEALFGQGAPNPYAFAGLGPSNLDNIPPPMASPRGLARIPRRP